MYHQYPSWGCSRTAGSNAATTVTTVTATGYNNYYQGMQYQFPFQQQEQNPSQAMQAFLESRERLRLEREEKEKEANAKALSLLRKHLSPEQLEQLKAGYFEVVGSRGRVYRILCTIGISGNVLRLDAKGGRATHRYCCHIGHHHPQSDHFLAQKLMLEHFEERFIQTANLHPL